MECRADADSAARFGAVKGRFSGVHIVKSALQTALVGTLAGKRGILPRPAGEEIRLEVPLGGTRFGSQPAKQEEVVPAETAPIRQIDPVESLLEDVADAYASEIDRSAMGTARRGHTLQYRNSDRGVRFSLRRVAVAPKSPFGSGHHELAVVAAIGPARLPGGCNLFRCPDVGLRQFNPVFCAGNLALMALRKSLIHILRIHRGEIARGASRQAGRSYSFLSVFIGCARISLADLVR